MRPHATCIHHDNNPHHGGFSPGAKGSDIPIPRTPAQGGLANTSSEEPQNTPHGQHIAFEIPSPAPCFAEGEDEEEEEEEEDGDDDFLEVSAFDWSQESDDGFAARGSPAPPEDSAVRRVVRPPPPPPPPRHLRHLG